MSILVNGRVTSAPQDVRVSLLDYLREHEGLTGTKLGCNQGACGACTVLLDGKRVLSCLTLAVQADGRTVQTIEGLSADGDGLHPMQQAFIDHDGLQCGFCTPGQICSALAMLREFDRGDPSYLTPSLTQQHSPLTREDIRERMSGNLCRCGAHNGIVDAIVQFAQAGEVA